MKKFLLWSILAASFLLPDLASAQSICFWTDAADLVPVRIYIDQEYLGDVTEAFSKQPELDTPGALSLDLTPGRHDFTAVDKYGRVYKGADHVRARENEIYYLKLKGWNFREVNRADYAFVFLDWLPVFGPYPYRYPRIHVEDLSPLEDQGLLIGMAATAVGATAAMGVAAAKNWNVSDERFPYVALGLGTEYFSTLRDWRNVAQDEGPLRRHGRILPAGRRRPVRLPGILAREHRLHLQFRRRYRLRRAGLRHPLQAGRGPLVGHLPGRPARL